MTGKLVASLLIEQARLLTGRRIYTGSGYVHSPEETRKVTVTWEAAEALAMGGNVEVWEELEAVYHLAAPVPADYIGTGEFNVRDPQTGLSWPVMDMKSEHDLAAAALSDPQEVASRLQSQLGPPPLGLRRGPATAFVDGKDIGEVRGLKIDSVIEAEVTHPKVAEWIKRTVTAETAQMDAALAGAAQAARELGAELGLVRHTDLGGGGDSPYELRLTTARGTICHRKKHKETWDEAVAALGL